MHHSRAHDERTLDVLSLRLAGKTQREIAAIVGMDKEAVKSLLRRVRDADAAHDGGFDVAKWYP